MQFILKEQFILNRCSEKVKYLSIILWEPCLKLTFIENWILVNLYLQMLNVQTFEKFPTSIPEVHLDLRRHNYNKSIRKIFR